MEDLTRFSTPRHADAKSVNTRPLPSRPARNDDDLSGSSSAWRRALARAIRDPDTLIDRLRLPEELRLGARRAAALFPLVVPEGYLQRMRVGEPSDPLLRQVLPLDAELSAAPGYVSDPVGDAAATVSPGILRKYAGRALLIVTGTCAVHCRYCFRRHFPYTSAPRGIAAWRNALKELRLDASVSEVILSGGDPLILTDESLRELLREIATLPHVRRLRIHSRLPVVLPERVQRGLLDVLRATPQTVIFVAHANHAAELAGSCAAALESFVDAGIPTLNQAVLLKGVNDSVSSLVELCERLVDLRVQPYYLHQLDPVAGAAHFLVPESRGRELVAELRRRLPGYAVPRYVREAPGELSKVPIDS